MGDVKNLGIKGYDSLRFVSLDLERSREFYVDKLDFAEVARSTPEWEDETGDKAAVFEADDIRLEVLEPQRDDSFGAYHREFHSAGIATVNFEVEDAELAWVKLEDRGATFIDEMQVEENENGVFKRFEIASPLGNATYAFVEKSGYDGYAPGFDDVDEGGNNRYGFNGIDHLTSNVRTLKPLIDWFGDVLGMEKFWNVQFHTSDTEIGADKATGSGLKSIVMWDPESGIKFANNEPMRPYFNRSQIQVYLEDFGGPGVQHAAFGVNDIVSSVAELREQDVPFQHTPGNYYDAAPQRLEEAGVSEIDEDWDTLRDLEILVDGTDEKYMLQIFLKEAAQFYDEPEAGPFFIEVIQRKGSDSFGEGNFRALFEAIERDQQDRFE